MGKVFSHLPCIIKRKNINYISKNMDTKSFGIKNMQTKSIGFHNQNPVRILFFGSQTKIPGK